MRTTLIQRRNIIMKALSIVGATASGKTSLSIEAARRFGCEIICCDSMQIYKHMDIGTAKATADEQKAIPHHMMDFLSPDQSYSAADYAKDAYEAALSIEKRGKLPLFCGGTGLYLEAVRSGRHAPLSKADEAYRNELLEISKTENGKDVLYDMLLSVDKSSAEAIHKNNVKRVIRALEIYRATGKTKSEWDRESKEISPQIDLLCFCIVYEDRNTLYSRIDQRVDKMIEDGLREETEFLLKNGYLSENNTASQAIGYKEYLEFLRGEATEKEAIEKIKLATRHYAKRQLTWFSAQSGIIPLVADKDGKLRGVSELCDEMETRVKEFIQ